LRQTPTEGNGISHGAFELAADELGQLVLLQKVAKRRGLFHGHTGARSYGITGTVIAARNSSKGNLHAANLCVAY